MHLESHLESVEQQTNMFRRHSSRVVNFTYPEKQGLETDHLWHRQGFTFEGKMEEDQSTVSKEQFDFLAQSIAFCRTQETKDQESCVTIAQLSGYPYMVAMWFQEKTTPTVCLHKISPIGGPDEEFSIGGPDEEFSTILCG